MSKIKELAEAHRLKVGFVGGAVVVSSIFGTCQFKPELPGVEEAVEAPAEEAAPAKAEAEPEAKEEAPEPSDGEDAAEESSE